MDINYGRAVKDKLNSKGFTFTSIAKLYKLSPQAVRQVAFGVTISRPTCQILANHIGEPVWGVEPGLETEV